VENSVETLWKSIIFPQGRENGRKKAPVLRKKVGEKVKLTVDIARFHPL
jgi:hypothetical protein